MLVNTRQNKQNLEYCVIIELHKTDILQAIKLNLNIMCYHSNQYYKCSNSLKL